ncbi:hypothetical protein MMC17_008406 [Xylographa soralifera]|nr:hypothetical protein [Xylographa soralifera]
MATPAGTTEDGYLTQFGTHHMGHALVTKLLLPTLLATVEQPGADVRILNLTSEGHNLAPSGGIIFDKVKLDAWSTWARYGQSKTFRSTVYPILVRNCRLEGLPIELANILYTKELVARYPTITSVAIHSGVIKTDLCEPNRGSNARLRCGMSIFGPWIFASLQEGAKIQIWAATTRREDLQNGAYYKPIASLSKGSLDAQNDKLAKTLSNWTEEELEKKGY